jgi:hypothetical protein
MLRRHYRQISSSCERCRSVSTPVTDIFVFASWSGMTTKKSRCRRISCHLSCSPKAVLRLNLCDVSSLQCRMWCLPSKLNEARDLHVPETCLACRCYNAVVEGVELESGIRLLYNGKVRWDSVNANILTKHCRRHVGRGPSRISVIALIAGGVTKRWSVHKVLFAW